MTSVVSYAFTVSHCGIVMQKTHSVSRVITQSDSDEMYKTNYKFVECSLAKVLVNMRHF
jgi:hypothetical protein